MENELAILLADLAGYTAMTEAHGGESAAKIVRKYMDLVDRSLVGTSKLHQRVGDQVVIIAHNAEDLLETARHLNKLTGDEHDFLSIHAGLHYGPVFIDGDNLFGSTINIAARIMNIAQRGEILCSQSFIAQLNQETSARSIGKHKLKNIPDELELFILAEPIKTSLHIDPVCHMQVDAMKIAITAVYENITFHFCSTNCRDSFTDDPNLYG